MTKQTRLARNRRTIAAATAGALLLGAAGTGIYFASANPQEPALAEAQASLTSIPASKQRLVCPAQPQLVSGVGENTDAEFAPGSNKEVTQLSTLAISDLAGTLPWLQLHPSGNTDAKGRDLTPRVVEEQQQGEPATVGKDGQSQRKGKRVLTKAAAQKPDFLTSYPLGGRQGLSSSVRSYAAPDGDLAGLAMSDCVTALHEQWITGLTTEVGATGVIGLSNPSETTAVVTLDFYGAAGKVQAPGSQGIVLAPGQTRSFLAAGFAPDEDALTARVRSTGGAVSAWATQTFLYGLDAGGVDYIPTSTQLARRQVVPGFRAQDPAATAKYLQADAEHASSQPALILTSPAASETTATVTAYSAKGQAKLPNNGEVTIPAQGTVVVPLDRLPAGDYTLAVEAENLVTAAARSLRGDAKPDVSFISSAGKLGTSNVVAVPATGDAAIVLGQADGQAEVSLTPITKSGAMGKATTVKLSGGTSVRKNIKDLTGDGDATGVLIRVDGDQVYGNIQVLGRGNQLSAYPIKSMGQANTAVSVSLSE